MWDLVGNPEDRFSQNEAHILQPTAEQIRLAQLCHVQTDTTSADDAELQKKIRQVRCCTAH